jgi:hypothetical protein
MLFPRTNKIMLVYAISDPHGEAMAYGREIKDFLTSISIDSYGPIPTASRGEDDAGLMIGFSDPAHPSTDAQPFMGGFKQVGLSLKPTLWEMVGLPNTYYDFDVYVGSLD